MNLTVRTGQEKDWGYVLSTWLRTAPQLGERETRKNHMRRALRRGSLAVLCTDDEPDTLVGWALAENGDLWWMYLVAPEFRKLKLSHALKALAIEESKKSD